MTEISGNKKAIAIPEPNRRRRSNRFTLPLFVVRIVAVDVATELGVTETCAGENEQFAPAGIPLHARVTVPLNPFTGATLTTNCAGTGAVTVIAPTPALNPNVGVAPVVVLFVIPPSSPCFSADKPAVK